VYGRSAYLDGGALSDHNADTTYKISPWTGTGWGPDCKLTLKFQAGFVLTQRHCADRAICDNAAAEALAMASAYRAYREQDGRRPHDQDRFRFGPSASADAEAAIERVLGRVKFNTETADFPAFGYKDPYASTPGFSDSGFQYFPIRLAGRWYVGAIGHDGIGWRESGRTLIGVYDERDGVLTQKAGLEIETGNAGLIEAQAEAVDRD
jgi:hypothetical protein